MLLLTTTAEAAVAINTALMTASSAVAVIADRTSFVRRTV